jgi:hypothetical protein
VQERRRAHGLDRSSSEATAADAKLPPHLAMRQVPVRELNQRTADLHARVELGERVEVTSDGVRVAISEPAQPNALDDRRGDGRQ